MTMRWVRAIPISHRLLMSWEPVFGQQTPTQNQIGRNRTKGDVSTHFLIPDSTFAES